MVYKSQVGYISAIDWTNLMVSPTPLLQSGLVQPHSYYHSTLSLLHLRAYHILSGCI